MYNGKNERIWHLLARKVAGEITEDEAKEMDQLLQANPHALYVQQLMDQEWRDTCKSYGEDEVTMLLEKHKQRLQEVEEQGSGGTPVGQRSTVRMFLRYAAIAASILLVLFAGLKWRMAPAEKESPSLSQHLSTQMGSRSEVLLPDGTKVQLNAGSSLDYPGQFNGNTREVQLTGEAYFDVAKDSRKPFFVHTRAFTVKVVGTVFNIRAYADEDSAVASLIHGSVEIQLDKNRDNVITLRPNEKLTVATTAARRDENKAPVPEKKSAGEKIYVQRAPVTTMEDSTIIETAWVQNKLAFKNSSFEMIASSLEKWFDADIRFRSEDKKLLKLTGTFEKESLEEVLHAFQLTGTDFRYKKDNNGVIWIE